jgi:hypothetical protein
MGAPSVYSVSLVLWPCRLLSLLELFFAQDSLSVSNCQLSLRLPLAL